MKLRERCEEILRLIDGALDPDPRLGPACLAGRREPTLAVVPIPIDRRPRRPDHREG